MTAWKDCRFKATHNSWQGNNQGARGDILTQLDEGVRFIELDLTDDDYQTVGDYQITVDDGDGKGVWLQGRNPITRKFREWLQQIATWSAAHPTHAPIMVLLDYKGSLSWKSYAQGDLAALNDALLAVCGTQLVLAETIAGGLPELDKLRGKIVAIVDDNARLLYARDGGPRPAVAGNTLGQVVEVHDNGNSLWYWTGQIHESSVEWARHGSYDSGVNPSIVLRADGWLVEVHRSQNNDGLWYHVGKLGAELEIQWYPSYQFDSGDHPIVSINAQGQLQVTHTSGADLWLADGTLDTTTQTVAWQKATKPGVPIGACNKASASAGPFTIQVASGAIEGMPAETLSYGLGEALAIAKICYRQVALVNIVSGDPSWLMIGQWFASAQQGDTAGYTFLEERQAAGWLTRIYDFDDLSKLPRQPVTFPATDSLDAAYNNYCALIRTIP